MKKMILKRCLEAILVLFLVSILTYAIAYFAPGDPADMYIRPGMSEEQKEHIREVLGVDGNLGEQYLGWIKQVVKGDFGVSSFDQKEILPQIVERIPATVLLMGSALVLAIIISIFLGLLAGYKKDTWVDKVICGVTYIGMSMPAFWLGIVMILAFSLKLNLFPTNGMNTIGVHTFGDTLHHLVLPVLTLCFANIASYTQYIRSSTISELEEEYVLTAMAKGTGKWQVLSRHVLKNSLLPIITLTGMSLASLVGGSFVIESVFGWPGLGTLAMTAINRRDYTMIMAFTMISCAALVIGNFLADMLYMVVDPRIRQGMRKANEK